MTRRTMSPERHEARMQERTALYDELKKLPRGEIIALAQRASCVNSITERTSKVDALHYILDCRLPVW